jgi:hypothetical protein
VDGFQRNRTLIWTLVGVLAVALIAVGAVKAKQRWNDRTPYPASAMNLHLTFAVHDQSSQQAALDALAWKGEMVAWGSPFTQVVVGQLDFTQPPHAPAGSQYALIIIDRRTGKVAKWAESAAPGRSLNTGWDSRFGNFAKRYPWLSATASIPVAGGWAFPGEAVCFDPDIHGPITFDVALDPGSPPVTDPARDLLIALGFVADNGHVFWAQQLAG